MKYALTISLLALAALVNASPRTEIEQQYKRWGKAALKNDADTILSILAPEYTLKTYAGKVISRKDYATSLRKKKAEGKPIDAYETKILSVKIVAGTAQVTSDETTKKRTKDPITGKSVVILHIHRYLDTWVRSGGVWRLRSTVTQQELTELGQ